MPTSHESKRPILVDDDRTGAFHPAEGPVQVHCTGFWNPFSRRETASIVRGAYRHKASQIEAV